MTPIVEIENLSHRFADGTWSLDRISLKISAGTLTILAGCNGSGKTTLLRHLNGLLVPESGTVKIDGRDVRRNLRWARRQVGLVFQDAESQIVGETVAADVAFGPENLGLDRAEIQARVSAALEAVDLTELAHRSPHRLSGGEKRRLTIAGVLAMDPGLVLFDEPFTSLDYPATIQVLQIFERLKQTGKTLLIATHELDKIIATADRLVVLQAGRVVRDGLPGDMLSGIEGYGIRPPDRNYFRRDSSIWTA